MFYLRLCLDKPGALPLRKSHRNDHLAYLQTGMVAQAGPLLDEDGVMVGSMMILAANDLEDARRFHDGDPFTKADLFDKVTILRWDRHIG
jgi:uncharacterized protein YciI